ncbi:MAG TPA: hypothetical protein VE111_03745 [Bradyrhizobium sp.]|nr:hypothetical protein [Bradyrhizobium sp.]
MKITLLLGLAVLMALAARAGAEPVDCGLFPDMHSRFACYDNLSRAPKPDPQKTVKPEPVKPKAATARNQKLIRAD